MNSISKTTNSWINTNGNTPLYISFVSILLGETPLKENMENPKGGVKKDVWSIIPMRIPIQIGSNPRVNRIGPNIGITMKIISIKSRIKPNKNIKNRTINKV